MFKEVEEESAGGDWTVPGKTKAIDGIEVTVMMLETAHIKVLFNLLNGSDIHIQISKHFETSCQWINVSGRATFM